MHDRVMDAPRVIATASRSRSSFALWLLAAFICGGASVAWAQTAFPLSSLIDPDVALYVEVAHPDQQWEQWERSELARRWKETGLEALFAKGDFVRQWRKVDDAVSQATPLSLTDHLRGLCGEGLSLAVFVPEQGPPQGLLVSRARSAAVLDATLKAWDTLEPPVKTERRGANRAEFFARRVRKGASEQVLFYARRDDVLVLSDQERLVAACAQKLGDLTADPAQRALVSPTRSFLPEAEAVVPEASTAAVWMYGNPRAWDRWLDREFDPSPGAQLARNVWRSLHGLGASVRLDDGVTMTVTAALDPQQVRPGWTAAINAGDASDPLRSPDPLSILRVAPADAVLVAGGSIRPAWWLQKLQMLQSDHEKEDWRRMQRVLRGALGGLDPWNEIGTTLLRDWGVIIAPRPGTAPSLRPADWSITTLHQLTAGADPRPELIGAIDDGLGLGMQLLAAHFNERSEDAAITPVRTREAGTVGRRMTGRAEWEFGYELAANRLLMGWPLSLVQPRFAGAATSGPGNTELARLSAREFARPTLLAWVNLEALRAAAQNELERARNREVPPVPLRLAHLVDRGFASVSIAPDRVELKLGGRFASSPSLSR